VTGKRRATARAPAAAAAAAPATPPSAPPADPARITHVDLDHKSIVRWSPEVEHERNVAIFDLLENNRFRLINGFEGPYRVILSLRDSNLVFDIAQESGPEHFEVVLGTRPFRSVVKDYFMICDSYFQAIRGATPSKIEAIDMARRGLHNEGSDLLRESLEGRVEVDHDTARRLFTLVCVLHIRG
jgi:uncharacterized protein (UPF0262 family)